MLTELTVHDLGVIEDLELVLSPGLTALTGETGAGKTLVVEALGLLLGGRADSSVVRHGAQEARAEARFEDGGSEVILSRSVAAEGRSRAYLDGRMASVAVLEERSAGLVELYAQHASQSLFQRAHQRASLDHFAGVDLGAVRALRAELAALGVELDALGGDERQRARELDLLTYELAEIDNAAISDAAEEELLAAEEEDLAHATARRRAVEEARDALDGEESGAERALAMALHELEAAGAVPALADRLRALAAETADLASELRRAADALEEDPERLEAVRARRQLLHELMRKYGASLAQVLATREELARRVADLSSTEERRAELDARRGELMALLEHEEAVVGELRRVAAPKLAAAVEAHLRTLGMARARLEVRVDGGAIGDEVELLLGANPGEPPLPLARVASGGELARAMLALRLVLTSAPATLVFDEVDAGIGGEAALAVGRALAELARHHQVLVVTHLAQVAAFAQHQVVVDKTERAGRTVASCRAVDGEDRVVELSRMLSGHPDSHAARAHASELLAAAGEPAGA